MFSELLPVILAISIRSTILIAVGCLLAGLIRLWSPGLTRTLLTVMFALLLLLPLVELFGWQLPLLPVEGTQPGAASQPATVPIDSHWQPAHLLLLIYGAGLACIAARGALRLLNLRRLLKASAPVSEGVEKVLQQVSREIGLKRSPHVRQSNMISVPFAHGFFKHGIVLPVRHEMWSERKLRIVLIHEMTHILRRDNLLHAAALCATVLNWYNPLAWLAFRQYEVYREEHCDMDVVRRGIDPAAYAECLLAFVPRQKTDQSTFASVAMSATSFKRRLKNILSPRRRHPGALARLVILASVAALSLPAVIGFSTPLQAEQGDEPAVVDDRERAFDRAASAFGNYFGDLFGSLADVSTEGIENAFGSDAFKPDTTTDDDRIRIVNKVKIVK